MKKSCVMLILLTVWAFPDSYVKPHMTKRGHFVEGHYKTKKNKTRMDNYSEKGNINPYTGKKGSKSRKSK